MSISQWAKDHPERCKAFYRKYEKTAKGIETRARIRAKRLLSRRLFIQAAKNKPCFDCKGLFNSWQLDFDHREPTKKSFTIGANTGLALVRLQTEINKCDVVCANCHRNRTHRKYESNRT